MTRYRRDPSWRRPGNARVVVAGSPLRLFRLSAGGVQVLELATTGEQPDTEIVRRMLDHFVDAGALHPEPSEAPFTAADVTIVMPCFGRAPSPAAGLRTIVVDDASVPPLQLPGGGTGSGASVTVLRHESNRGPAAARNTGLAAVTTPLVAFVDSDVELPDGWLEPVLRQFADPRVALVAPRVTGAAGPGAVAAYERRHSPLDLGDQPARISPGTRVSYVPAAAIVCRTDAVRAAGGFDDAMRVGEDVDLVWRLVATGHRCRYEPTAVVHHRPRASWAELARQRFGYGSSAAPLARRHPGALAPVRLTAWSAAVWALLAARRPVLATLLAAGTAGALVRKLRDVPPQESVRLTLLGHLAAGRQLAKAVTRVWWPVALLIALVVPKARPVVAAAVIAPSVADAVAAHSARRLADTPALLLDEMSYGVGVWRGVLSERQWGPLLPSWSTWPPRADG